MGRIIAIDYGTKRVGLATTDPLKIIATALDTVHADDVLQYLDDYCQKEDVECFVLGMPKNLKSEDTNATPHVVGFERTLKKRFPSKQVHLIDERFTSKMAFDSMIASGASKKSRRNKGNIDKLSAVIILQSYMESFTI